MHKNSCGIGPSTPFENLGRGLYKPWDGNFVPEPSSNSEPAPKPRISTLIAAALLLAALALVVLYTSRGAFLSPVALVVIAAIGAAALLLQLRLRPDLSSSIRASSIRAPLWLNLLGVILAVAAVFTDGFRLNGIFLPIAALGAVACFAISGVIVLNALRKRRN